MLPNSPRPRPGSWEKPPLSRLQTGKTVKRGRVRLERLLVWSTPVPPAGEFLAFLEAICRLWSLCGRGFFLELEGVAGHEPGLVARVTG